MADGSDRLALEREVSSLDRALQEVRSQLAAVRRQMDRQLEERAQLLQVVSHELRTPVTVIAGYNRLLLAEEAGALTEEQRCFLEESQRSCERLDGFVRQMLDASNDALSLGGAEPSDGSLEDTIRAVLRFMAPLFERRALRLELSLAPDAVRAHFDAQQIDRVLTNLLNNAVKYAKSGGCVQVSSARVEDGGLDWVEVAVSDDGPGVAEQHRQRIFQPHVRLDPGAPAEGMGLGLAICRRIVDAHGGAITLTDAPGGGCRFAFTLPLCDTEEKRED